MRLISKSDIEAIQLSNLLMKSNSCTRVYAQMQKAWESDKTKIETSFTFAACAFARVYEEEVAPERHKYLSQAIDALSDCITQQGDWWMARFLRSSALQAIVISSDGMSLQEEEEEDDCDILIKQQMESKEKEPYFLCPYLIKAKTYIFKGNVDQAVTIIEEGLNNVEPKYLMYTLNIFLQPFGDTITIFRTVGREDLAKRIKNFGLTLFPKSLSLVSF